MAEVRIASDSGLLRSACSLATSITLPAVDTGTSPFVCTPIGSAASGSGSRSDRKPPNLDPPTRFDSRPGVRLGVISWAGPQATPYGMRLTKCSVSADRYPTLARRLPIRQDPRGGPADVRFSIRSHRTHSIHRHPRRLHQPVHGTVLRPARSTFNDRDCDHGRST